MENSFPTSTTTFPVPSLDDWISNTFGSRPLPIIRDYREESFVLEENSRQEPPAPVDHGLIRWISGTFGSRDLPIIRMVGSEGSVGSVRRSEPEEYIP